MAKFCPSCHEEITQLKFECQYTECGTSWGYSDADGSNDEHDDSSQSETNYEDFIYYCPECDHCLDPEDLLDECPEEEEDEEEVEITLEDFNKLNSKFIYGKSNNS